MKKKDRVKKLNHELNVLKAKLSLIQSIEKIHINIVSENNLLKIKNNKLRAELKRLECIILNYQTPHIAW